MSAVIEPVKTAVQTDSVVNQRGNSRLHLDHSHRWQWPWPWSNHSLTADQFMWCCRQISAPAGSQRANSRTAIYTHSQCCGHWDSSTGHSLRVSSSWKDNNIHEPHQIDLMCPYFQYPIVQWKPSIHLHTRKVRVCKGTPAVVKEKRNSFRNHSRWHVHSIPGCNARGSGHYQYTGCMACMLCWHW